jgi:hypothetical protein
MNRPSGLFGKVGPVKLFYFFLLSKTGRGGMEGTSTEEGMLKREIEDLPVVRSLSFIRTIGRDKTGYRANLRCHSVSLYGDCTDGGCTVKRVGPILMSGQHPTLVDCLCELKSLIMRDHDDN